MTCTDNESENSGNEWIPNGEVNERQSARSFKKFNCREVGKRRGELSCEGMTVAGRLGSAPIGHGVEQMDDPVAKLDKGDDQSANSGNYIGRCNPGMGDGGATQGESFFEPSHKLSLSGCDT